MDRLQAMLVFTTVADRGGITAASSKLEMTPSAVTKKIAALERELGVQLVNRTTRRLALTESGQRFYEHCVKILAAVDDAESSMRHSNLAPSGRVKIVMPYSFGRVTFAPELPKFVSLFPEIVLDVYFSDEPVDLIKEGFDLGILVRELADSRLIRRVIHQGPEITVASPEFLARNGIPRTPRDLEGASCIVGNFGDEWRYLDEQGAPMTIRVNSSVRLHNGDALREAAVAGLGFAQSTWWLFRKDMESGRLVKVLDRFARPGWPVSVLYPDNQYLPAKVAAVIKFLSEITKPGRVRVDAPASSDRVRPKET